MRRILVTGALGQIGSELVPALRERFGADSVVATDIREMPGSAGPFACLDCMNPAELDAAIRRYGVGTVYHLAALLSAVAEGKPQAAWHLNTGGIYNVLEAAREHGCAVFFPSSIGAFGPSTPRTGTPQDTIQRPATIYGVTKVAGELLCDYYARHFGVDVRGLRLPGLISCTAPPGGGTTDYAVDIFHHAVRERRYTCFLKADTSLDMMYMPDAVRAMIELMAADGSRLTHRNAFNITAMNFTPAQLAEAIRVHIPEFTIDYAVDPVRQAIAESWPRSVDGSAAAGEWGWKPAYTLSAMTADMLAKLGGRRSDAA